MAEDEESGPPDTATRLSQEGYRNAWLNVIMEELKLECSEGLP
jgi:hypothetical protein